MMMLMCIFYVAAVSISLFFRLDDVGNWGAAMGW